MRSHPVRFNRFNSVTSNGGMTSVTVFRGGTDLKKKHRNFGPAGLSLIGSFFEAFVTLVEM